LPWIDVNGVSLYYELSGKGNPTVVLLHEMGGSLGSWDGVAPGLAKRFRTLRYDQRGLGLSEKVREPFSHDDLTNDLEALLKALKLEPPYCLVSVAASAVQVLRFYERHPEQVSRIVLGNPAPGVDASRAAQLDERAAKAEQEGLRKTLDITLDKSYPPTLTDRETYETYRGRYLANDPVGFANMNRMFARANMIYMLSRLKCPTLVIAGRQDAIRPAAMSEQIAKTIPGARFESIDAGHFMPTTAPKAMLALIEEFAAG
jgi:3-oxoadipate enol-lactonase